MAKKKVIETTEGNEFVAFDLYRKLKDAIPDGTYLPNMFGAIEYLLADMLLLSGQNSMQSKKVLDAIKKDVLSLILKQKEMRNEVN